VQQAEVAIASGQEPSKELKEAMDSWDKREAGTSPEVTSKFNGEIGEHAGKIRKTNP
jgi:hypothetical protein